MLVIFQMYILTVEYHQPGVKRAFCNRQAIGADGAHTNFKAQVAQLHAAAQVAQSDTACQNRLAAVGAALQGQFPGEVVQADKFVESTTLNIYGAVIGGQAASNGIDGILNGRSGYSTIVRAQTVTAGGQVTVLDATNEEVWVGDDSRGEAFFCFRISLFYFRFFIIYIIIAPLLINNDLRFYDDLYLGILSIGELHAGIILIQIRWVFDDDDLFTFSAKRFINDRV